VLDKLIVMLTHDDRTVPHAAHLFDEASDLPVTNWGFKDVGLAEDQMKAVCGAMNDAGKTTFLEVVSYDEAACLRGAQLAVDCGFDYLLGTIPYQSVAEFTQANSLKYLPFVGDVSGSPSVLTGSLEGMVQQAVDLQKMGAFGIDLLGYRYLDGDPEALSELFIKQSPIPTVLAGSIASVERLQRVQAMNPWLFTMGGALFTDSFVANEGFRKNLEQVCAILQSI
jgi:hypothetical protein